MSDSITLKWGTLKGFDFTSGENDTAFEFIKQYHDYPTYYGAAQQRDTPEQQSILCQAIDTIEGEIWNDWEGTTMTKEEAKTYIKEYRK